ncbi:tRNA (adenosine(37)-N6)-threonylcarbamoyltransferase complex ATPase subunit type 1 TsaE [Lolliginicoccus suaedae]|uniref:tRNA (adenosine(37)-N6)-threonylcarbamoyltransferase complex ATPase subunit type 1 TsaE n=1 Tax=Lolliginicoccus suaedae TaxID=2605429 RepID=UPI0011EE4054|nr:tRNA (adenosine(37)-N6)-threonylcarbamoyltransferase complex ATPase subunit type 1 TsaE [Lolliginicoccus suaedae]
MPDPKGPLPVYSEQLPTVQDTEAFGQRLAAGLAAGDVVLLGGPLGAGKTALARGIAAGLGVQGRVSSPTFIIAREHRAGASRPGGLPPVAMVHADLYRLLGDAERAHDAHLALDELDALDLDTELEDAVLVVEWGEGLVERLVDRYLWVQLDRDREDEARVARWEWVDAA